MASNCFVRCAAAGAILAFLAGCATPSERRYAELLELAQLLPGTWSNVAQAESEAAAGHVAHPAEWLAITRVSAPVLGRAVFHVRELSAGDARRVLSDRLWVFDSASGGQLVAQVSRFAQPARWAGEGASEQLLRSLMPQDVAAVPGCLLAFRRVPGGYDAGTGPGGCPAAEGSAARLVQHWRVRAGHLQFAEQAPGAVPPAGAWYDFARLAGE